jgi:hypothetical protein
MTHDRSGSEPFVNDKRLAEIAARCDAATAGPWKSYLEVRDGLSGADFISRGGEDLYLTGATIADYDFIADARQDIPDLLKEIARLKALLQSATKR